MAKGKMKPQITFIVTAVSNPEFPDEPDAKIKVLVTKTEKLPAAYEIMGKLLDGVAAAFPEEVGSWGGMDEMLGCLLISRCTEAGYEPTEVLANSQETWDELVGETGDAGEEGTD